VGYTASQPRALQVTCVIAYYVEVMNVTRTTVVVVVVAGPVEAVFLHCPMLSET